MKRILCLLLAVMLLGITALAADSTTCTVQAAAVTADAGETVDVTVSVVGNPGFTNFAILLDYDREALTLQSITPAESELLTAVNTDYKAADGKSYGFVCAAGEDEQSGDGVLFTATFRVADGFTGSANITPIVQYIRNNEADHKVFAELAVQTASGTITPENTQVPVLAGDLDGNGIIELRELSRILRAYKDSSLMDGSMEAVDQDKNGILSIREISQVLRNYKAGG